MSKNTTGRTLAQEVNEYLQQTAMTMEALSEKIGYSRTAVSLYLGGKYNANQANIEEKLAAFLEEMTGVPHTMRINGKHEGVQHRGFFTSSDVKMMLTICKRAQEDRGLGLIVGQSGYGKTCALKLLSKQDKRAYIECDDTMSARDLITAIERAFQLPSVTGTIWRRLNSIREYLNRNPGWLLITDETDKLISKNTVKKVEILRGIFDQADVGVVLAGEPKLEELIKINTDRLANRIDFYGLLQGLSDTEAAEYLSAYDIEPDALDELKYRACNDRNGCFRLLNRTLGNCFRIMNGRNETVITPQVVREASSIMLL